MARLLVPLRGFLDWQTLDHCFCPSTPIPLFHPLCLPPQILHPEECMYAVGQVSLPGEDLVDVLLQESWFITFATCFLSNKMFREGGSL